LGGAVVSLHEVLSCALGCEVPAGFAARLARCSHAWDEVFRRHLEDMACELRPDLTVWEIDVDDEGLLREFRLAPVLEIES
jgi:hypothetical protein